jgi:hypothetical protein
MKGKNMALNDAPIVEVLKFDEEDAYDHDRPISGLIRTQLLHLHHAEHIVVPAKVRTNININHLLTERQASEYIAKVTALVHQYGKRAGTKRQPKKRIPQKKSKKRVGGTQSKKNAKPAKKRSFRR